MTDNTDKEAPAAPSTPLLIHAQYLKDFSFENPHAPDTLRKDGKQPKMDMEISLDVNRLEDDTIENLYDVSLMIRAKAERGDKTMFIADLTYSAIVSVNGLQEKQHHPLLFVEVPHMIFPFARQIISDATQAGGYIPLQLNPVDFRSLYLERFADQIQKDKKDKKDKAETKKQENKKKAS